MHLDGIGVDTIVKFGKSAIQIPGKRQAMIFILFEPLKFFDKVELKFNRYPGGKLKSDILVCVCTAITARLGDEAAGIGSIYPLPWVKTKLLSPALFLNPSNSRGLKSIVCNRSHIPKNSIVLRFLIQFWIT